MNALSIVTTASADTDLTEPVSESILAAVEHYLIAADEHAEVRPYVAGEHTAPVKLQHPLIVVTGVEVEEQTDGAYLVHVTGAQYREDYAQPHPLAELFRTRGHKGAHGLVTVPAWEDVRIGDAHIVGLKKNSRGGSFLPSGVFASRLDTSLRIAVGRDTVNREVKFPREWTEQTVAVDQGARSHPARQTTPGRHPYRPVVYTPVS